MVKENKVIIYIKKRSHSEDLDAIGSVIEMAKQMKKLLETEDLRMELDAVIKGVRFLKRLGISLVVFLLCFQGFLRNDYERVVHKDSVFVSMEGRRAGQLAPIRFIVCAGVIFTFFLFWHFPSQNLKKEEERNTRSFLFLIQTQIF